MISLLVFLVIWLIVLSLLLWLVQSAPIPGPLAPQVKWALMALVVIIAIVILLNGFGIVGGPRWVH